MTNATLPIWGEDATVMRTCRKCGVTKPAVEFRLRTSNGKAQPFRHTWCRDCEKADTRARSQRNGMRNREFLWRKAGLDFTAADYERWFAEQGGVCAICHQPETAKSQLGTPRGLHVDHDHETGQVRGLLCHFCNTSLAAVERGGRTWVEAAMAYLAGGSTT